MHPIERLRYVARAEGASPSLLVREAAGALAAFQSDPAGLVTAARRLLDRHVTSGPLWWLAARVLVAQEPMAEAWRVADELDTDPTARVLAGDLPDDATVLLIGWPELAADAVRRRGDLEVLVASSRGEGDGLARRLRSAGVDAIEVPDGGIGAAAAEADLVLLEVSVLGPGGLLAPVGSHSAAAVAHHAGTPVWAVAGAGRVLPGPLWSALMARDAASQEEPWDRPEELVPLSLIDEVAGPEGRQPPTAAAERPGCPVVPELLKALD